MPEQTTMTTYTAWDDVETYMRACVDVARFLPCCAKCPNYETKWSCPPYDFDVQALWRSYTRIHLIFQKIEMPDTLAGKTDAASAAAAAQIRRTAKDALLERLYALERENPGSRALSAGSCSICPLCARASGKPCRVPEKMRYSIESLGGDVGETAQRYFNLSLLWSKNGEVPAYSVLATALLMK